MTVVRENIFVNTTVRDRFLEGVRLLDQPNSGIRASDLRDFLQANNLPLGIRGIDQELSIYDIFVFWHLLAMSIQLSVGNAAHGGPIFLPWHRMYMIRLEEFLQQVLDEPEFGLPYWDWAADGHLPVRQQWRAELWTPDYLGEARGAVRSGPMGEIRVRLVQDARNGNLVSVTPRPLQRAAGLNPDVASLPRQPDVDAAQAQPLYDQPPWNRSVVGHRNILEGWINGPQLHNRVHVWVGGDMAPGTSPNDPVFFLNHCNVDRLWEQWMAHKGRNYEPKPNRGPSGHRLDDVMVAIIGQALTPQGVLDPAQWYAYDSLLIA
ncbi:tyrosinase family protein [Breoghania sp. L-A4]|uniref:tyrosinase family protein n=1 Tax=Breoghania sp. L-A4 TaxID=2304600 RepID=UPI000E35B392|nr:tyrosinase family protein [Breoghania sp. L-A4]AXS39097.1 tyrosinase family protein [Breoghania sp. L-A4]